jgi:hypothetical protein
MKAPEVTIEEGTQIQCLNCESVDFVTRVSNVTYHTIEQGGSDDEFIASGDMSNDVDTETYCASCKADFKYSVNI